MYLDSWFKAVTKVPNEFPSWSEKEWPDVATSWVDINGSLQIKGLYSVSCTCVLCTNQNTNYLQPPEAHDTHDTSGFSVHLITHRCVFFLFVCFFNLITFHTSLYSSLHHIFYSYLFETVISSTHGSKDGKHGLFQ